MAGSSIKSKFKPLSVLYSRRAIFLNIKRGPPAVCIVVKFTLGKYRPETKKKT